MTKGWYEKMKIAVFDEEHEKDLQIAVNKFLETITETQLKDIKYSVAIATTRDGEQIYCYSALILYRN